MSPCKTMEAQDTVKHACSCYSSVSKEGMAHLECNSVAKTHPTAISAIPTSHIIAMYMKTTNMPLKCHIYPIYADYAVRRQLFQYVCLI